MNTHELESYMKADPWIARYYGGVVRKDLLPCSPMKPSFYIVNQDTSEKVGSHWIVMFQLHNKISEYFDPLGKEPDSDFRVYMTLQSRSYQFNDKRCQNYQSNLCGQYCLVYCYFRARGYSMTDILDMFNEKDLVYNDQMVYFFYEYTN